MDLIFEQSEKLSGCKIASEYEGEPHILKAKDKREESQTLKVEGVRGNINIWDRDGSENQCYVNIYDLLYNEILLLFLLFAYHFVVISISNLCKN